MRTYGRLGTDSSNPGRWVEVDTDAQGRDDFVWLTTLVQCLLLNIGESPFYASWGLPAHTSIVQQVAPDFYVVLMQQRFAQYFAALLISRLPGVKPAYQVNVTTNQGVKLSAYVAST